MGQKPTFYPEITNNLMSVNFVKNETLKMWIFSNIGFWNCEFCQKWDFHNVIFCEKWDSENANFVKKWGLKCEFLHCLKIVEFYLYNFFDNMKTKCRLISHLHREHQQSQRNNETWSIIKALQSCFTFQRVLCSPL